MISSFLHEINTAVFVDKDCLDCIDEADTVTTCSSDSSDSSDSDDSSFSFEPSSRHGPLHSNINILNNSISTVTHNHARPCAKERISFEMLVDSLKYAQRDANGRLIGRGSLFFRTPEVLTCMESDLLQAKRKYADSLTDVLKIEGFGWNAIETADGKITAEKENAVREIVWMKNKYPYAWEDGVEHFLCWSTGGPTLSVQECINAIQENVGPDKEVAWFTNSMENRSVPEIDHIQVIVRSKPSISQENDHRQ